jgi:hypothetical protein
MILYLTPLNGYGRRHARHATQQTLSGFSGRVCNAPPSFMESFVTIQAANNAVDLDVQPVQGELKPDREGNDGCI